MEQVAGIAALANICDQGGVCACEDTIFALLEGDTMCLDVICLLLFHTPFIGPEEEIEAVERDFDRTPETSLTPDQDSNSYCFFMEAGPLLLLSEMSNWHFSSALFASIRRTQFYPQIVQRLARIIAREGMKPPTRDGKRLGKLCRRIISPLVGREVLSAEVEQLLRSRPVSERVAASLLEKSSSLNTVEVIGSLMPCLLDGTD